MMKKPSIVVCMHNYRDVQVIHCVKSYQCHTHYHLKYTANEKKKNYESFKSSSKAQDSVASGSVAIDRVV